MRSPFPWTFSPFWLKRDRKSRPAEIVGFRAKSGLDCLEKREVELRSELLARKIVHYRSSHSLETWVLRRTRCAATRVEDTPPKAPVLKRPKLLDAHQSHIDELMRSTRRITAARIGSVSAAERRCRSPRRRASAPQLRRESPEGIRSERGVHPSNVRPGSSIAIELFADVGLPRWVLDVVQLLVLRLSYSGRFVARHLFVYRSRKIS